MNLVGHSMGGLDSRHFITHLGERFFPGTRLTYFISNCRLTSGGNKVVASLVTLGTPHRGSSYGDW